MIPVGVRRPTYLIEFHDVRMLEHLQHLDFPVDLREVLAVQPSFVHNLDGDLNCTMVSAKRGVRQHMEDGGALDVGYVPADASRVCRNAPKTTGRASDSRLLFACT